MDKTFEHELLEVLAEIKKELVLIRKLNDNRPTEVRVHNFINEVQDADSIADHFISHVRRQGS